ncbi:MAG: hypothetical protein LBT96_01875 [Campylobacteraceae bacterium]|jgi:hypothetical protein|nr:hypothetical protein [Campylobacteraceae bacterium]
MGKKILFVFYAVVCMFIYSGCFAVKQPIHNVENASIANSKDISQAQIEQVILEAGAELGWKISKIKDGLIVAILTPPSYMVVIDIKYDASTYSITYRDGANLQYDGDNIDKNYNKWIKSLDEAIQKKLLLV